MPLKEKLIEAVRYVADQTSSLARKIIGRSFPINSLTIFAHSPEQFESLTKIQSELGKFHDENNGPRIALYEPIVAGENRIAYLRIRKPDPDRPQVGCNDFETDYELFKKEYLTGHPHDLRLIQRPSYEMIEFSDPDFEVLAYVVSR